MRRVDLTTKILLGAITLLLAVIAFRPIVDSGVTSAQAQIGSTPTSTATESIEVELESRINYKDNVLGVTAMDEHGVFFVHTANMVEVYRIDALP